MATYIAMLRAINVGGTGKLPMAELRSLCEDAGLEAVSTYIQSGNVVFETKLTKGKTKALLEQLLEQRMGKPVGVILRTAADLDRTLREHPFADAPGNRVLVVFYPKPVTARTVDALEGPDGEEFALHERELFIHFPNGQARSKVKIPQAQVATARNLNTVRKLAQMAR